MKTIRLEAFSNGVPAMIITIMVLELLPPRTADFEFPFQNRNGPSQML